MSILVGPCSNYGDYTEFIEGHNVHNKLRHKLQHNGYDAQAEPSPVVRDKVLFIHTHTHNFFVCNMSDHYTAQCIVGTVIPNFFYTV